MVTDIHDGDAGRSMSDLLERDTNAFFNQANTSPCALAFRGGEGSWLEDQDGNRYLDWYGNNCHNLGHAHPSVVAAVEAQLATLAFVPRGFTAEPPVRLAERLAALWPGEAARVSLVPGGAEAVEIALSLARVCTGRSRVISFYTAYHGRSAGALSVSGARHRDPRLGPGVPGTLFVPPFHPVNGMDSPAAAADRSLQAIDDALKLEGDVAALIAEPVRNGPYVPRTDIGRTCARYSSRTAPCSSSTRSPSVSVVLVACLRVSILGSARTSRWWASRSAVESCRSLP